MEKGPEISYMECKEPKSGLLMTVARELVRYKLDLVGVQQVRWDKGGRARAGDFIFSMEKEMNIISWEQNLFYTMV
jgi:hypothetical protein